MKKPHPQNPCHPLDSVRFHPTNAETVPNQQQTQCCAYRSETRVVDPASNRRQKRPYRDLHESGREDYKAPLRQSPHRPCYSVPLPRNLPAANAAETTKQNHRDLRYANRKRTIPWLETGPLAHTQQMRSRNLSTVGNAIVVAFRLLLLLSMARPHEQPENDLFLSYNSNSTLRDSVHREFGQDSVRQRQTCVQNDNRTTSLGRCFDRSHNAGCYPIS